ncbi:DNA methyltransferase [Clostridium baratii]
METSTIWRFKERGSWSTHKGDYRGNWSPFVPRNIILRYSEEGNVILDQFVGSGTTMIECALLNRIGIGIDINKKALDITKKRVEELRGKIYLGKNDARNLYVLKDNSIDLICTHPPYLDIIKYSNMENDLSNRSLKEFLDDIRKVAKESFRVLKKNKFCAIMMGDIRKKGYVIPLAYQVMQVFLDEGFKLREIIIKEQFNCSSTEKWISISKEKNFLMINHENIFILRK